MIAFDKRPTKAEINTAELQEMLEDIMAKAVQKTGTDTPKNE